MRERELKPVLAFLTASAEMSLPMRERELKLDGGNPSEKALVSLPMRERELKRVARPRRAIGR